MHPAIKRESLCWDDRLRNGLHRLLPKVFKMIISPIAPVDNEHPQSSSSLDLFSTSQKSEPEPSTNLATEPVANMTCAALPKCVNNAPFFAWSTEEKAYSVAQGCCNDWQCPKCGIQRAKHEYGRIVNGCRTLAVSHDLYFLTITCRGKEMSLAESEANYLKWTNKLLTACRYQAKKRDIEWHYVQVTERQKRGHPHSHILTTYKPHDLYLGTKEHWQTIDGKRTLQLIPALRSDWFEKRCASAGLGNQYDISKVDSVEGASRYVAKYLFKDCMFSTEFPKHWKRIRYSQEFPDLPERETDAFVLLKSEDWLKLAKLAVVVNPRDDIAREQCQKYLLGHDILLR